MSKKLFKTIHAQNQAYMLLKLFYDTEYFYFIRDFIGNFKNTIQVSSAPSSQPDQFSNPLYFSKSDSESLTLKKHVEISASFKQEQEASQEVDFDKYIASYNQTLREGDTDTLDIYNDK